MSIRAALITTVILMAVGFAIVAWASPGEGSHRPGHRDVAQRKVDAAAKLGIVLGGLVGCVWASVLVKQTRSTS